jgi:hypothetical protein
MIAKSSSKPMKLALEKEKTHVEDSIASQRHGHFLCRAFVGLRAAG